MKKLYSFLAAAFVAVSVMAQTNLVSNPNFANGLEDWTISFQTATDSSIYAISATEGDFSLSQAETTGGRVDLFQDINGLENGAEYTISFEYKETHNKFRIWSSFKTDDNKTVNNGSEAKEDPLRTNNGYYSAAADWTPMNIDFTFPVADSVTVFHLEFRYYKQVGNEGHLRNVSLVKKAASAINNVATEQKTIKIVENGKVVIIKNGVRYNALGAKL